MASEDWEQAFELSFADRAADRGISDPAVHNILRGVTIDFRRAEFIFDTIHVDIGNLMGGENSHHMTLIIKLLSL